MDRWIISIPTYIDSFKSPLCTGRKEEFCIAKSFLKRRNSKKKKRLKSSMRNGRQGTKKIPRICIGSKKIGREQRKLGCNTGCEIYRRREEIKVKEVWRYLLYRSWFIILPRRYATTISVTMASVGWKGNWVIRTDTSLCNARATSARLDLVPWRSWAAVTKRGILTDNTTTHRIILMTLSWPGQPQKVLLWESASFIYTRNRQRKFIYNRQLNIMSSE